MHSDRNRQKAPIRCISLIQARLEPPKGKKTGPLFTATDPNSIYKRLPWKLAQKESLVPLRRTPSRLIKCPSLKRPTTLRSRELPILSWEGTPRTREIRDPLPRRVTLPLLLVNSEAKSLGTRRYRLLTCNWETRTSRSLSPPARNRLW